MMKHVLIVGDGMSDRPVPDLGGKTPLEVARKPNMDRLAKEGCAGSVVTCPPGFSPGTEVCILSIMGYDPAKYFGGRGPLEALGRGIELKKSEVAYRCNLVTVKGDIMEDYSAGHITDEEAEALVQMLDKRLGLEDIRFHPGVGYRHLMVWRGGADEVKSTAPHDIAGQEWKAHLPTGKGKGRLQQLMEDSRVLLEGHEVNRARRAKGLKPANMIWLWSPGRAPSVPGFREKYGLTGGVVAGGVVSAVDVVRGIGVLAGLEVVKVPGATGYFDTNYRGKGDAAVKTLKTSDFVFVHVEAPDEAGHQGLVQEKIKAIEQIDEHVVGTILKAQPRLGEMAVLLLPDHATPLSVRNHVADPVPFALFRSGQPGDSVERYDEGVLNTGSLRVEEGWRLLDLLFAPSRAAAAGT